MGDTRENCSCFERLIVTAASLARKRDEKLSLLVSSGQCGEKGIIDVLRTTAILFRS